MTTSPLLGNLPGTEPSSADLEKLETRSWITPELASQARVRRVTSAEGAAYVGRNNHADYSGLLFPYVFPGEDAIRGGRLRRDCPEIRYRDGIPKEENKYLTAPGSRLMLYFMPGTPPERLTDTNLPVIVTEGEKKTISLHRLALYGSAAPRFLPVGIAGVSAWQGRIGIVSGPDGRRQDEKGPIPDFDRASWSGRKAYIAFDSDLESNAFVKRERNRLARELRRRGARVHYLTVPEGAGGSKQGVDDWLAAAGAEPVLSALQRSQEVGIAVPVGFSVTDSGVSVIDPTGEKEPLFICSKLEIVAVTRDSENDDWGRLLEWRDLDGRLHQWAMPMSLLSADGNELRSRLLSGGLEISPNRTARELLVRYIMGAKPQTKARAVGQIGWHGAAYVLPSVTIGSDDDLVLFQTAHENDHNYRTAGTLGEWRSEVGERCRGNSLMLFGVGCAFAGPLLHIADYESGGFHLRGGSSTGKTTILRAAGSVMGGGAKDGFIQSWRATANGLEAVASLHNDGLLPLDELAQVDPKEAAEVAYLLANGRGKARMNRTVAARKTATWRLIFLSTGEVSLADHVRTVGQRVRAGQEVRLIEIDADAGAGYGVFQDLHGAESGQAFADSISRAARSIYGTPLLAFLEFVTKDPEKVTVAVRSFAADFIAQHVSPGSCGEVLRAAARFALVGAAGEIATEAGITGWREGEACDAAVWCFKRWLAGRGSNDAGDAETAIRQVRRFIENHGAGRFQALTPSGGASERIYDRAGYKGQDSDGNIEYYILPETFKDEVCKGFNSRMVAAELEKRDLLRIDGSGKRSVRVNPPEGKVVRVYAVRSRILEEE